MMTNLMVYRVKEASNRVWGGGGHEHSIAVYDETV